MVAKVEEPNIEVLNIKNIKIGPNNHGNEFDSDDDDDELSSASGEDDDDDDEDDVQGEDKDIENVVMEGETKTEEEEDNARTANPNLLSHFWKLANLDESIRCDAVVALLRELEKTQNKDEINYTVQRLVKGLSSSRKAARQGFSTALTHVLTMFDVKSDHVLALMSKHLAVQGSFKGHEESEAYFGQVFGILSLCRSKLDTGGSTNVELLKKSLENLLVLMRKKSYLAEISAVVICENILKCIDYVAFQSIEPMLKNVFAQGWKKCSPEELMISVTVQWKFQDQLSHKYFKESWGRSLILHESHFKDLSRVLMDTTNTAHPRVHVLWDRVLDYLFTHVDDNSGLFEKFWNIVVLQGLMNSTHERKFLVMNVILKMASRLSVEQAVIVFGESILRCIINSCQSKMNYLYNAVRTMLQKLPNELGENKEQGVISSVIKCLVGSHGHVAFDSITKTKVVEELISKMSHDFSSYFDWLKKVFAAGTTDLTDNSEQIEIGEKDVKECRCWVAEQLIVLLRVCKSKKEETMLIDITNFLFFHAYFSITKKSKKNQVLKIVPQTPLCEVTRNFFRVRFNTALSELANIFHPRDGGENKNPIGGVAEDGELYAWKVLSFAKKILEIPEHAQLNTAWTPDIYDTWNSSLVRIAAMQTEGTKEGIFSLGTQLLFIHTALQLFVNRDEAVDIIKELDVCLEKSKEKKRRKKTEPHWTEVLTEILLGFMAQSSHLMRQVVDLVYPTLVPHLTEDALALLIKAIVPAQKDDSGNEGMEFEDLSDVEELDEAEMEEKEIDKEKDDKTVEGEEKIDNYDTDSESDDSNEEGSDFEIDETFKAELKVALGDAAVDEEECVEGADSEDDEEDIDMDSCKPEELKAMDQALAAVFKARNQKQSEKKKKEDRKVSIMHFKLRVLDLIEIFIKKQPTDIKVLLFLEPLYAVINASNLLSDEQPLFERTLGIVKNKLCTLHEYPSGKDLDVEGVHSLIERLMELARTSSTALLVEYITQGIVYLVRVLRGNPELKEPSPRRTRSKRTTPQKEPAKESKTETNSSHIGCLDEKRLIGCYKTALAEFMTKKSSHLQPVLFNKLIQRFPYLGWRLADDLPLFMNNGCNNFRKLKAVEMLKLLFSNKGPDFEKRLTRVHKTITENLITAFKTTNCEGYSLKARQFQQIVNLADTFIKEVSKYSDISDELDCEGLKDSLTQALNSTVISRSTSVQSYCKKVVACLGGTRSEGEPKKKKKKKNT